MDHPFGRGQLNPCVARLNRPSGCWSSRSSARELMRRSTSTTEAMLSDAAADIDALRRAGPRPLGRPAGGLPRSVLRRHAAAGHGRVPRGTRSGCPVASCEPGVTARARCARCRSKRTRRPDTGAASSGLAEPSTHAGSETGCWTRSRVHEGIQLAGVCASGAERHAL